MSSSTSPGAPWKAKNPIEGIWLWTADFQVSLPGSKRPFEGRALVGCGCCLLVDCLKIYPIPSMGRLYVYLPTWIHGWFVYGFYGKVNIPFVTWILWVWTCNHCSAWQILPNANKPLNMQKNPHSQGRRKKSWSQSNSNHSSRYIASW